MDIDNDDEILRTLAHGQSIDYSTWPSLLERLMTRLEKIVITDFQIPKPPTQPRPSSPSLSPKRDTGIEDPFTTSQPSLESLPPICYRQLLDIQNTMNKQFPTHPPHTIQRLSELLLNPTQHHRSLPSYLHALDRVVHVTSPITSFPLPPAVPDPRVSSSVLSNGTPPSVDPLSITWSNPTTGTAPVNGGLGSDEALGGALLTPISWLNKRESSLSHTGSNGTNSGGGSPRGEVRTESTETIDGPNGPGGVETVSVSVNGISSVGSHAMMSLLSSSASSSGEQGLRAEGGVTQGELLRQEQKAGVVPASQLRIQREPEREERTGKGDENGMGEDDEMPHARGPEEIGMEDMGPQEPGKVPITGGEIDVEAAVGRRPDFTEEKEEEKGKEGEREDGESSGKAGEDADGDSNMKIETKDDDEQSTTSKRAAEDDIGSEAGEKRVKEEMDIEPQPDSEIKPDDAKEDAVREEEDTKMETDPEPEAKTEHAEENAKAEPAKAETQACVDEATTSPKDTRE